MGLGKDAVAKWRKRSTYPEDAIEPITLLEEHALKRENSQLKKVVQDLLDVKTQDNALLKFADMMLANPVKVPKWHSRVRKGTDVATVNAFLSDWHLDEFVDPKQIGGCNAFDRHIAKIRCNNYFDHIVKLSKTFISGIKYDGIYLLLGGDIFSGNIHEELKETNESTIIDSVIFWTPLLVSGIQYLADNFGKVHIPCVVGNHGRMSRKPIAKNRVQDNFDYLFYNMLAMQLKDDDRITWDISASPDVKFTQHGTRFCLTHGDQFRGGTGISGPILPWKLGDHRKRKVSQATGSPYDWLVFGHWHTLTLGVSGMIVNGSLKGYDEFANIMNFEFEPPQQAFWLVQPRVGVTGRWPIHVLGENENYAL